MAVKKKPYRVTVHEIVTENIRLLLASHDEGFKDLCLPLELSAAAIYAKKRGDNPWKIEELCDLCTVYRIPIEWFFLLSTIFSGKGRWRRDEHFSRGGRR